MHAMIIPRTFGFFDLDTHGADDFSITESNNNDWGDVWKDKVYQVVTRLLPSSREARRVVTLKDSSLVGHKDIDLENEQL